MATHDDTSKHPSNLPPLLRQERFFTVASILTRRSDKQGYCGEVVEAHVPWIRMQGKWLAEAGFEVRTRVRVRVMFGCLVLTID